MINEWWTDRTWKEPVVAYFKIIPRDLPSESDQNLEKSQDIPSSGSDLDLGPLEQNVEVLTSGQWYPGALWS
jgi:hypothetical protein